MYDYGIYEIYLNATETNSTAAEWAANMREEALNMERTDAPKSEPTSPSSLVALVVVIGLLVGSVGAFAFGVLKVAEGASSLNQEMVSSQLSGSGDF